jgi:hypothetical protein
MAAMNKTLVIIGCIALFLSSSIVANAQILSPIARLSGDISQDAMAFFVGETDFSGNFYGYPADSMIDTSSLDDLLDEPLVENMVADIFDISLLENLHVFPLLGCCTFEDINGVTIVDIQDFQEMDFTSMSPADTINFVNSIERFSNVDIIAENGQFIFGVGPDSITTKSEMNFAISSAVRFEIEEGDEIPFLVILTESEITMQYSGESSLLYKASDSGNMIIKDSDGNEIWNEGPSDKMLFIKDDDISFVQDSSVYVFPISSKETKETASLYVSPAESRFIDIPHLMESIANSTGDSSEGMGIPDFSNNLQGLDELISVASSIINGGMVLIKTNDTFVVDNSPQTFSGFGFARGNGFDVTITGGQTPETTVSGDCKLIFLGNHFYTSQAKYSENGVAFPFLLVIPWALAIGLYLLFRFYLKKETKTNAELDGKIKRLAPIFHIVALIIAFILMDREISFQFGISAIDAILGQGISPVFAVLIVVELVMWVLGYLILAIPVYIIAKYGLKFIEIGKGGKGICKGASALSIWFFCAIYFKLIVNLIFLMINPTNFLTMG